MLSHILVTRRLRGEHSRPEKLSSPSCSTQICYSASAKLLNSSRLFITPSIPIREVEAAFESGFHLVWTHLQEDSDSPTQIDETGQKCSGFKGQTPPRDGLSSGGDGESGRSRWEGAPGDTMTLVGAC